MVGALEGLALSEHYGLEARPGQRCNSAEPVQGDLALQQLWEAPLQMQGSGRDHVGPERTVPGGPGMQPAARSSAEPRASSAQRPRGPQRVRAGAGRKLCMTDALLLWTEVEEATFFVHYQEKEGAEDRFNAEVTEFILFLQKLFPCLTHIRNREALAFLSVLRPRPVLSGLRVSRKKQQFSSREAGLRDGDQLPEAFPQGPCPFHGWEPVRGLLPVPTSVRPA